MWRVMLVIAGVFLAVLTGGAALAAIPDSSGVIHGCYARNGALRVINWPGHVCARGSSSLSWNRAGPVGPPGPTGATGSAGPAGATGAAGPSTAGPAGLDVSIYTNATVGQDSATVMCPVSHPYAISGGGQVFNQGTDEQEPLSDSTPYNSGTELSIRMDRRGR